MRLMLGGVLEGVKLIQVLSSMESGVTEDPVL